MGTSDKNFGKIALSLSGGGYRAAAFHLGTLEMLDRLGLLGNISALSTVSGGTITGATYAVAVTEKISFAQFNRKFYRFLRDRNVISTALSNLGQSVNINGSEAMPSLIRAAADVYDSDELLGGKSFGFLLTDHESPLEEIAFNATEFRTGNSFRFQKSKNAAVRSGNNFAEIGADVNGKIRLADIAAASSCFPSGFEPIRFPADFVWSSDFDLTAVRRRLGGKFENDIALMDGGIFDNQGIDSIRNIYARLNGEFDVYIISDTSPRNDNLFDFPPKLKSGRISLKALYAAVWFLLICAVLTVITIAAAFINSVQSSRINVLESVFLYFIPLIFSLTVIFLILLLRRHALKLQKLLYRETGIELWKYLKHLTLPEITELVISRLRSVITMTSSVFMKRIRTLGFAQIFADPNLHDKLLPNLIYDLDNEPKWGEKITSRNYQPAEKLRKIAREAESYSTNLWFLHADKLDNLIACGNATICFKVLKYLLEHKSAEIDVFGSPEAELFKKVERVWLELNEPSNAAARAFD